MTLGKKINELRKINHYSQEDLARLMNVSRQTISKWETDMSLPDIERIKKLCEIFNVSLNELLQVNQDQSINHDELQAMFNQLLIINKNYEKDSLQLKKRQKDIMIIGLVGIVILSLIICMLISKLADTDKKIEYLSSNVNDQISIGIDALQLTIDGALADANSILTDFDYRIDEVNLKEKTMKILLNATFKQFHDSDKVEFIIKDEFNNVFILFAEFKDGSFQFYGNIPFASIYSIDIRIIGDNQTRTQTINGLYSLELLDIHQSIDISSGHLERRVNKYGQVNYYLNEIVFIENIEDEKKSIFNQINELNNYQENDVRVIYDDFIIVDKIEYKLYYDDQLMNGGVLINIDQSDTFELKVNCDLKVLHGDILRIEAIVYDTNGHQYHIYKELKASTLLLLGFQVIDEQLVLEES